MKEKLIRLAGGGGAILASLAAPLSVLAQFQPPNPVLIRSLTGVQAFICTVVVTWLFTFLIVLGVVFIIFAAFKYLTAGGDPEKVKSASHTLMYAVVAIVVAIVARAIPPLVGDLFGAGGFAC